MGLAIAEELTPTRNFPTLFDRERSLGKYEVPQWYALYTRSRHEKFLNRELNKKGVETFLPLRRVTRRWSDRKKMIEEPLFQGYLFVRIPLLNRLMVLNTTGAVCLIGSSRTEPSPVPEHDIWSLRRFIEEEIQVDPYPYLKQGQKVRIRSGPLKRVEGFIVRKDKHNCRLVLSLDLMMQSISVEVDEACVEVV
ncbi:MAG: UpxY family transcription antiterminator [Candidatus Omnitrophica bacterium]|nr:UpxY family transcription antiterminator [Candidatus Omnitrophota bacterium]